MSPATQRALPWARDRWLAPALLFPAFLFVVGVLAYPLALEIRFSLSNAEPGTTGEFIGLANFIYLAGLGTFRQAVGNTLVYLLAATAIKAFLGLAIALALSRPFRGRRVVYALLFLPFIFPTTEGTVAWYYLLAPARGAIDRALFHLHLIQDQVGWLSRGPLPMASVIAVNAWRGTALFSVLVLAGLRAVPPEVLDAAATEGAGSWQRFAHVLLPLLRPALALAAVLSILGTFGDFTIVHILTGGGPINRTQILSTMAFQVALRDGDLGVGAAIALSILPLYLATLGLMFRLVQAR